MIIPATPLTIVCPAFAGGGPVADGVLALAAAAPDGGADPLALVGAMITVIAIVGLSVMLTISVRGKIARRNAERPSARELMDKIKQTSHPPHSRADADATTAQMLETAQRLAAQLDNKAERLEQLIARADDRLAALGGRVPDPPPDPLPATASLRPGREGGRSGPRSSNRSSAPRDPLTQTIYELTDTGRSPLEIAKALDEQIGKVELILALREG